MTINELLTLCGPVVDRLHAENDHTAAILLAETCDQLRAARDGKPMNWGGGIKSPPPSKND